jgi:hypothetical protein
LWHTGRMKSCTPSIPLTSTEELSELLATLYAAPLKPEMWQTFFDRLSAVTKISSGYLITGSESQGQEILAGGGFSFNPEVLQLYKEHYGQMDPFWSPFLRNPRVQVIQGEDLVSHDQLMRTEFYNDLLAKNEMESMTLLSCSFTPEQTDVMSVWRRSQDGPMDERSMSPSANSVTPCTNRSEHTQQVGGIGDSQSFCGDGSGCRLRPNVSGGWYWPHPAHE